MLLYCGNCEQWRDCNVVLIDASVWEDDDVGALCTCSVDSDQELVQSLLERSVLIVKNRYCSCLEAGLIQRLDLNQVNAREDRIVNFQYSAVAALLFKEVTVRTDIYCRIRNDLFSDGIDRRVCNLCEKLLEEWEQELVLLGQYRKRNIRSHGSRCFYFVHGHREDLVLYIFECISENLIELVSHLLCVNRDLLVGDLEFRKVKEI